MIPPSVLHKHGIKFSRVIQKSGEFIVSFSGGYHSGFNLGWNEAEAINFGTQRWLDRVHEFKICTCKATKELRKVERKIKPLYRKEQKKNQFRCEKCARTFSCRRSLQGHVRKSHPAKERQFSCDICQISVKTHDNIVRHMKTHGAQIIKFRCTECRRDYANKSGLKIHLISTHQTCINNKSLEGYKKYVKNMRIQTKRVYKHRELQCDFCGATLHGRHNLNAHLRTQH